MDLKATFTKEKINYLFIYLLIDCPVWTLTDALNDEFK